MPGTREGGIKARQTALERFGEEYIINNSRKGGRVKTPKGFAKMDKRRLYEVSAKGGRVRPPAHRRTGN